MDESWCPHCESNSSGYRASGFSWPLAHSGEYPDLARYVAALRKLSDLRLGSLWACQRCDHWFWLDAREQQVRAIPAKNRDTFVRWSRQPPILTPTQHATLRSLMPIEIYKGGYEVPAYVRFSSHLEPGVALIRLEREPEILFWTEEHVRLASDIYSIEPCDYALPHAIRVATHNAGFIEHPDGYVESERTRIQSSAGHIFLVEGSANFFRYGALRGADMTFPGKRPLLSRLTRPTIVEFPRWLVTWYLAEPPTT